MTERQMITQQVCGEDLIDASALRSYEIITVHLHHAHTGTCRETLGSAWLTPVQIDLAGSAQVHRHQSLCGCRHQQVAGEQIDAPHSILRTHAKALHTASAHAYDAMAHGGKPQTALTVFLDVVYIEVFRTFDMLHVVSVLVPSQPIESSGLAAQEHVAIVRLKHRIDGCRKGRIGVAECAGS